MDFVSLLKKYNDTPQIGIGGSWLSNVVNAIKNIFTPAKPPPIPQVKVTPQAKAAVQKVQASPLISALSGTKTAAPSAQISPSFTSPVRTSSPQVTTSSSSSLDQTSPLNPLVPTGTIGNIYQKLSPFTSTLTNLLSNLGQSGAVRDPSGLKSFGSTWQNLTTKARLPQLIPGGFGAGMVQVAERSEPSLKRSNVSTPDSSYNIFMDLLRNKNPYGTAVNRGTIPTGDTTINPKIEQFNKNVDTANTSADTSNAWLLSVYDDVNAIAESNYNQLSQMGATQDELNQKNYEDQKRYLEEKYGIAGTEADNMIKDAQAKYEANKAAEEQSLTAFGTTAEAKKAEMQMYRDELLKKSVKAQRTDEEKLRNVFANLGTAESSSFINKLTEYTGERAGERAGVERTAQTDIDKIIQSVLNATATSGANVKGYKDILDQTIRNVGTYKQGLGNESIQSMADLIANLNQAKLTGQGNLLTARQQMLQDQVNRANTMGNYGLQSSLLDKQIAASNATDIKGVNNTLIGGNVKPSGVPSDMWGLASQLYQSGLRGSNLVNQLKSRGGLGWDPWYDTLKNMFFA